MATNSSNPSTAEDAIEQYLQNNTGWHEVATIANAIGYSHGHVLTTGTDMANNNVIERRKNTGKPVVGYLFNGDAEVPGSNRQRYIQLIQMYSNGPTGNLQSKSLSDLQDKLRNVADGTTVFEFKVEFQKP